MNSDDTYRATELLAGIGGQTFTAVSTKYGATLTFTGDYSVSISTRFTVHALGESLEFDPNRAPPDAATPLRNLRGLVLARLEIRTTKALHLNFANDSRIVVDPEPVHAWEVDGPNNIRVMCGKHGELTIRAP